MEKYKNIINLYLKNWVKLWKYEVICLKDVWFNYLDINNLFNLIVENEIIIKNIEVFTWNSIDFLPPDFYYHWCDKIENYKLVKKFLNKYNKNDNLYFTLVFDNLELENYINILLIDKYRENLTDKEINERKKRWWEFID